jgi:putative tricarboxylic transport membrane protein
MTRPDRADSRTAHAIKSPQDFVGGLVLIAIAAFALWQSNDLPVGSLGAMGPGMLPRSLAVLLGALGAVLAVSALLQAGEGLHRWSPRAMLFVFGAVVAFGLTVRPLGLAVAGPLAVFISGFASEETRWVETIVFGLVMTAFCIGLFKYALGLPIPLAPWLLGY